MNTARHRYYTGGQDIWILLLSAVLAAGMSLALPLPEGIPALLVFTVLCPVLFFSFRWVGPNASHPLLTFGLMESVFVFMEMDDASYGPHLRIQTLIFGLSILLGALNVIRYWRFLWQFWSLRLLGVFFATAVVYSVCHSSDFILSRSMAGYGSGSNFTAFGDVNAKSIIFLTNMNAFMGLAGGLLVFRDCTSNAHIAQRLIVFIKALCVVAFMDVLFAGLSNMGTQGESVALISIVIIPLLVTSLLWLKRRPDCPKLLGLRLTTWLPPLIVAEAIFTFLGANKTVLIDYVVCATLYLFLQWYIGYPLPIKRWFNQTIGPLQNRIIAGVGVLFFILILLSTGLVEHFADKLDYFNGGFSSLSTLDVRKGNWYYFNHDWESTMNVIHALFGYGLGASRKTVFFISVTRGQLNMVQTVHNSFVEYFYDYGAMALFFYASTLVIAWNDIRTIFNAQAPHLARLFSIISLISVLILGIYGLTDGIRVQIVLTYYALRGFCESLRWACNRNKAASAPATTA